ncbi:MULTISPECIES: hypothetical protein [Gordonia]|uniref:Uncharacterized protein n=1 Tax=Gordonia sputi NBRC 100414 TaxID=1089453 RepID=H5U557_9ACTN|nr:MULTISPECIES: hypothetical protein [Gordonia]NKY93219.1 hypothetical protein [Gordonia sputi]OBC07185.1 hypothetical protein A5785_08170 [Gordonia sp. 852002-50395_SCH5434458]GAB40865.1 hypothetical protein GOSPT_116_00240 [Gordonia sputi NBRC 100414]
MRKNSIVIFLSVVGVALALSALLALKSTTTVYEPAMDTEHPDTSSTRTALCGSVIGGGTANHSNPSTDEPKKVPDAAFYLTCGQMRSETQTRGIFGIGVGIGMIVAALLIAIVPSPKPRNAPGFPAPQSAGPLPPQPNPGPFGNQF